MSVAVHRLVTAYLTGEADGVHYLRAARTADVARDGQRATLRFRAQPVHGGDQATVHQFLAHEVQAAAQPPQHECAVQQAEYGQSLRDALDLVRQSLDLHDRSMHPEQRALDVRLTDAVRVTQRERRIVGAQQRFAAQFRVRDLAIAQRNVADVDEEAARGSVAVDVDVRAVNRNDDVVGRQRGCGMGPTERAVQPGGQPRRPARRAAGLRVLRLGGREVSGGALQRPLVGAPLLAHGGHRRVQLSGGLGQVQRHGGSDSRPSQRGGASGAPHPPSNSCFSACCSTPSLGATFRRLFRCFALT